MEGLFKDLFPSLYALAQDRIVRLLWRIIGVQGTTSSAWMPVFVRDSFADNDTLLRFFSKLVRDYS